MSENTDLRREGRGNARGGPNNGNCAQEGFGQHQQQQQQQQPFAQDFGSWRSTMPGPQASAAGLGPEAYNNFYYGGGYNPFAGDIRDSIAAIWSRTSPSGEGVAFSGGYGQFPDSSPGQFAANSTPAGQFAANLTGHFASTSELGMFGNPGGEYSGYGQQYGYEPQYTQWPDGSSRGGYSYLGSGVQGGEDLRSTGPPGQRDRVMDVHQGLDNMKLGSGGKSGKSGGGDSNGYQQQQPKKMSWANVASQPAKPQPLPAKTKKPGVLPPPAIIPSKPPVQLGPDDNAKMDGPPPTMPQPLPNTELVLPQGGPPPFPPNVPMMQSSVPPPSLTHVNNKNQYVQPQQQQQLLQQDNRSPNMGVPAPLPGAAPSNQGPRAARATANSVNSGINIGPVPGGPPGKPNPVLETLRSVNEYNPKSFELSPNNARFFVIKSFSEDDIHRSIKYEIWCSTDHGNKRLDTAFRAMNNKGPIYLLFSVNGSGHFCGVAEMLTAVDYNSTGSVWVQDKFKGQFKVKWIYVKDVPNGQLRHIRLENNENKPVTNSRDTQEVPQDKGKMVLKIIHSFKHTTSIFDDFIHYEKRQQEEEESKKAGTVPSIPGMNLKNEAHHGHSPHGHHREEQQHHGGGYHRDGGRHNSRGGGMAGGPNSVRNAGPSPQVARN